MSQFAENCILRRRKLGPLTSYRIRGVSCDVSGPNFLHLSIQFTANCDIAQKYSFYAESDSVINNTYQRKSPSGSSSPSLGFETDTSYGMNDSGRSLRLNIQVRFDNNYAMNPPQSKIWEKWQMNDEI